MREENSKFSLEGKTARAVRLQREEMRFSDHFSPDANVQCFTPGHSEVFKADILPQFATPLAPGEEKSILTQPSGFVRLNPNLPKDGCDHKRKFHRLSFPLTPGH